jgi:hypothetical protein
VPLIKKSLTTSFRIGTLSSNIKLLILNMNDLKAIAMFSYSCVKTSPTINQYLLEIIHPIDTGICVV